MGMDKKPLFSISSTQIIFISIFWYKSHFNYFSKVTHFGLIVLLLWQLYTVHNTNSPPKKTYFLKKLMFRVNTNFNYLPLSNNKTKLIFTKIFLFLGKIYTLIHFITSIKSGLQGIRLNEFFFRVIFIRKFVIDDRWLY